MLARCHGSRAQTSASRKQSKLDQDHVRRRALRLWPGNPGRFGNRLKSKRRKRHGSFCRPALLESAQDKSARMADTGLASRGAFPFLRIQPDIGRGPVCKAGGPITHHTCAEFRIARAGTEHGALQATRATNQASNLGDPGLQSATDARSASHDCLRRWMSGNMVEYEPFAETSCT